MMIPAQRRTKFMQAAVVSMPCDEHILCAQAFKVGVRGDIVEVADAVLLMLFCELYTILKYLESAGRGSCSQGLFLGRAME
eukprot:365734-Chlamydomonas_euryale.AAC.18